jgi:hypothetical protein
MDEVVELNRDLIEIKNRLFSKRLLIGVEGARLLWEQRDRCDLSRHDEETKAHAQLQASILKRKSTNLFVR